MNVNWRSDTEIRLKMQERKPQWADWKYILYASDTASGLLHAKSWVNSTQQSCIRITESM